MVIYFILIRYRHRFFDQLEAIYFSRKENLVKTSLKTQITNAKKISLTFATFWIMMICSRFNKCIISPLSLIRKARQLLFNATKDFYAKSLKFFSSIFVANVVSCSSDFLRLTFALVCSVPCRIINEDLKNWCLLPSK